MKKILLILSFLVSLSAQSQITCGAQSGELYLSTDWYMDNNGDLHFGICRSIDNGATITLQYESSTASPPSEMEVGRVLGDATPGAIFNYCGELWVSLNYGVTWEFLENLANTNYMVGEDGGTIYRRIGYELSQSTNFGTTFTVVTDPISCPIRESGFYSGEFYGINGSVGVGLYLDHTLDYANTFTEIPIDSSVAFWAPGGIWPEFSRGTEPGEIYLVSWWLEPNYKIFHSIDTGYTWAEKYESETIDLYYWRLAYTAGREPGSFYVMRSRINPAGDHIWLYIDYSNDYGETFTTYFHDLDSTITNATKIDNIKISIYPNPFTDKIKLDTRKDFHIIEIIDLNGKTHSSKTLVKENTTEIIDLKKLKKGIYILKIKTEGQDVTKKIIKI